MTDWLQPTDEWPHEPGPEQLWSESWYLDFHDRDGEVGGYVRVGRYPNLGVVWYWATVVGPGRRTVLVADHEVPVPAGRSLELRAPGLWADHNVETPLEHFSLGLEAFGVALDDPADAYRGLRGDRTPLGFDLEWETDGAVFPWPMGFDRYEIPCRVHGEVLVGEERIELDGFGQRDHSWGVRDWWSTAWCWNAFRMDDGRRFHTVSVRPHGGYAIGYDQHPDRELQVVTRAEVVEEPGPEGIPTGAVATIEGRRFEVEPLAWAPLLLVAPDGRESRFPRALARFTDDAGVRGLGWIEFNQPPAAAAG
ncbi:MAG: hypothetical protein MUF83_07320 [Acidimicrobiales bacterium]|jgi:hypothetical protein|nr:hypothetical protein [Acidimicrobiales bacterium]